MGYFVYYFNAISNEFVSEKKFLKCTTFVCSAEIGQSWIIRDTQRIQCPGFETAKNRGQTINGPFQAFLAKNKDILGVRVHWDHFFHCVFWEQKSNEKRKDVLSPSTLSVPHSPHYGLLCLSFFLFCETASCVWKLGFNQPSEGGPIHKETRTALITRNTTCTN